MIFQIWRLQILIHILAFFAIISGILRLFIAEIGLILLIYFNLLLFCRQFSINLKHLILWIFRQKLGTICTFLKLFCCFWRWEKAILDWLRRWRLGKWRFLREKRVTLSFRGNEPRSLRFHGYLLRKQTPVILSATFWRKGLLLFKKSFIFLSFIKIIFVLSHDNLLLIRWTTQILCTLATLSVEEGLTRYFFIVNFLSEDCWVVGWGLHYHTLGALTPPLLLLPSQFRQNRLSRLHLGKILMVWKWCATFWAQ